MLRLLILAAACLALAACTTTDVRSAAVLPAPPPAGARVLVVQPDIQLSILTMAGLSEPRADWTTAARLNLQAAVEAALEARGRSVRRLDPADAMGGPAGQLLRLNGEVGRSILAFDYGGVALPTKPDFDWTLGEGARVLASDADYALFVHGGGTYSSTGRLVAAVLVGGPTGMQQVFASLVDLRSGRIVWFNVAIAGPEADIRTPQGAAVLARALLREAPL